MASPLKLPVGIENFEKIRREGFYYVDKTGLIKELLDTGIYIKIRKTSGAYFLRRAI